MIDLVRAARRTAASMRERLSADFWTLLLNLEGRLSTAHELLSEAEALQQVETALQILAALAGLAQENMNRGAGWRFLDMGRRIERGINTCRFTRTLAGGKPRSTISTCCSISPTARSPIAPAIWSAWR